MEYHTILGNFPTFHLEDDRALDKENDSGKPNNPPKWKVYIRRKSSEAQKNAEIVEESYKRENFC